MELNERAVVFNNKNAPSESLAKIDFYFSEEQYSIGPDITLVECSAKQDIIEGMVVASRGCVLIENPQPEAEGPTSDKVRECCRRVF